MKTLPHKIIFILVCLSTFIILPTFASADGKISNPPDMRQLVAGADLHYDSTVDISEAGLPLGNGTMGSLLWTSPIAIKFQINRVDVYANNRNTQSFFRRNHDYAYGCGFVDIETSGYGDDSFPKRGTLQHLSVYDGLATVKGQGITARATAWQQGDVMAVQIEDTRKVPEPIRVMLRMLRPAVVHTRHHSAVSEIKKLGDGRIALRQTFREGDYYCTSAVVIAIAGRKSRARISDETGGEKNVPVRRGSPGLGQPNETEIQLVTPPARGKLTVLIASAATFNPQADVVAAASKQLDRAQKLGFAGITAANDRWWTDFWSRGYVDLHSEDGQADRVEQHYNYFLYLMASCSRGPFAPNYGGLLFSTRGDWRMWGAQQWWTNSSLYYRGLLPAGRHELVDTYIDHFYGMRESLANAARQFWGSRGMVVPETFWFDGIGEIPEEIAAEVRDLYLFRKPWSRRSEAFRRFAATRHPQTGVWNWTAPGYWKNGHWVKPMKEGDHPMGHVLHLLSPGAELAALCWQRYEYTGDRRWLRQRGYPLIRELAEFYHHFPNLKKEADGRYHIHHVNNGEGSWDARDTVDMLGALHGIFPIAIKAAETLDCDLQLRKNWKEIHDNLAPLPTTDEPGAKGLLREGYQGLPVLMTYRLPASRGNRYPGMSTHSARFWEYDMCNAESRRANAKFYRLAAASYDYRYPGGAAKLRHPVHVLSVLPVVAAHLGRAEDFRYAVTDILTCRDASDDFCAYKYTHQSGALPNRMTLREGINAIGAQRLGTLAHSLHEALCQSRPGIPGGDPVINLLPAWPSGWDARFRTRTRGGCTITAACEKGKLRYVEITSPRDNLCRLRHPWGPDTPITATANGKPLRIQTKPLMQIPIRPGQTVRLVPGKPAV